MQVAKRADRFESIQRGLSMGQFHPSPDMQARNAFLQAIAAEIVSQTTASGRREALDSLEQKLRVTMEALTQCGGAPTDALSIRDRLKDQMAEAIGALRRSCLD